MAALGEHESGEVSGRSVGGQWEVSGRSMGGQWEIVWEIMGENAREIVGETAP